MGRFFYLTRRVRPAAAARQARRPRARHPKRWCATALGLLAGSCLLYLVQVNGLTTKSYQIERLRQQVAVLRLESRELESRALQLQSYQHLNDRIQKLNLVPSGNVRYVSQNPPTVSVGPVRTGTN